MKKLKLPITHLLFRNVSGQVAIKGVDRGNLKLNLGVFNENMGSIKQLDFLKSAQRETMKEIKFNDIDQGNMDYGKGTLDIPDSKDFWVGDPI